MVKKWIKQLNSIKRISRIDFDEIILHILEGKYQDYDIRPISGYKGLYRLRSGQYRIIFQDINKEIRVLFLGKRGDVYNWLNHF